MEARRVDADSVELEVGVGGMGAKEAAKVADVGVRAGVEVERDEGAVDVEVVGRCSTVRDSCTKRDGCGVCKAVRSGPVNGGCG